MIYTGQCPAIDPRGQPCVLGHGHGGSHMTPDGMEAWRQSAAPRRESNWPRSVAKLALAVWTLAYPVVSCSPLLLGPGSGVEAVAVGGASLMLSAVIFFPWVVGIVILGVIVAVTGD